MMRSGPFFLLRLAMLSSTLALGVFAISMVGADMISPHPGYFPRDAKEAGVFSAESKSAGFAALIGIRRGDLWTRAAVAEAAPVLFETDKGRSAFPATELARAYTTAKYAAKLSPHDTRNWLVLAALAGESGSNPSIADALKLSYYTGPSNPALTPLRLSLATRGTVAEDEELRGFVELEIRQFVIKQPDLKSMLTKVYADASPVGRKTIEGAIDPVDPAFLKTVRTR